MKGIIFNYLAEMVEEKFGLEAWDALLKETGLDGHFIASETYPDEDLVALVKAANHATGIEKEELIRTFGRYILPNFKKANPQFFDSHSNLKSFLLTVDRVIHVEVRKLHTTKTRLSGRRFDRCISRALQNQVRNRTHTVHARWRRTLHLKN